MNHKWTKMHEAVMREMFAAGDSYMDITKAINRRFKTRYSEPAATRHGFLIGLRREGPRPVLVWSDNQNAELRLRMASRERYVDIASALGFNYSAVRTQARRLGLTRPSGPTVSREPERSAADRTYAKTEAALAYALMQRLNALMNVVPDEYMVSVPLPNTPDPVTNPRNLTLVEIGRSHCHWITNDDTSAPLYCGHPTDNDKGSWCAAHHQVVVRNPIRAIE